MSNMQSKVDESNESFYWYLKTIEEQEQKRTAANQPDNEQEINVLRFIKLFEPTVERLIGLCEKETGMSVLTVSSILERLEESEEIKYEKSSSSDTKIVQITKKGLERLKNGG